MVCRQTERIGQVQSEIADETGKSPLDPNVLGISVHLRASAADNGMPRALTPAQQTASS